MRAGRLLSVVVGSLAVSLLAPPSGVVAQQSSGETGERSVSVAAGESWTPSSHTVRVEDGKLRTTFYGAPAFRRLPARGWEATSGRVEQSADPQLPLAAAGAYRPVRFGNNPRRLLQLDLDGGPVALSSRELAVVKPVHDDGTVRYPNVATDTDLEFEVGPAGVKENFILRSPQAPRSFRYHLSDPTGQLGEAQAAPGGGVLFSKPDSDGVSLLIPPAVAYEQPQGDALPDIRGTSAHLTVTPAGDGFDISVALDEQWLVGKQFPIVLDPTLQFTETSGAEDCWVQNGTHATTSLCFNSNVAGNNSGEVARSLVRFELADLTNQRAKINSARFELYQTGNVCASNSPCTQNSHISTVPAGSTDSWQWLSNATWFRWDSADVSPVRSWANISVPDSGGPGTSLGSWAGVNASGNQGYRALSGSAGSALVSAVQNWTSNPTKNHGFHIRGDEPSLSTTPTKYLKYSTTEKETVYWPRLTVDYTPLPTQPQNVTAVAGDASARVKWDPPTNAVDAQVSSYTIRTYSSDGGKIPANTTCTAGTTDCPSTTGFLISGLDNGKSYTFGVTATGPAGEGPEARTATAVVPKAPDTTGPVAPTVSSSSHPFDASKGVQWYPRDDISVAWSASDPSGVAGYSFLLDQVATTEASTNVTPSTATSASYLDRASGKYWFHVRAKDGAGNWGSTAHFPIQIDVTAPDAPSAPAGPNQGADRPPLLNSYDRTIDISWVGGGTDAHSGFAGFSYTFDRNASGVPDAVVDADADDRAVTSGVLTDGAWYLHVVAVDKVGNRSTVHRAGPYLIGEATLTDVLLGAPTAGSDELGLEQFGPYDANALGNGTAYTQLRTGNVVTQQDLFTVPGQGLNTVARLTHNAQAAGRDSGVGRGWNLSVTDLEGGVEGPLEDLTDASVTDIDINRDVTLAVIMNTGQIRQDLADSAAGVTGKLLEFVDGDGTTHRFTRAGSAGGRWLSPPGVDLKVRESLDSLGQATKYELIRPDGVVYTATRPPLDRIAAEVPVWRVTSVRDRSGNELTYRHENFGPAGINRTRLVEISHNRYPTAPIARFSYEPFVLGATNNNAGVLRSVTTLPGQAGERRTDVTITDGDFFTGTGHDLTAITEAAHSTDANGRRTTRYTYNPDATLAAVTDPRSNSTALVYTQGRPAGTASSKPTVPMLKTLTDRTGATTSYTYNPLGTVGATETTVERPGAAGEGANTSRYEISERRKVSDSGDDRLAGGNVTKITDAGTTGPDGAIVPVVTSHGWYANKLTKTTDGVGAVTQFGYNDLGLLTSITQPAPNKTGAAALNGTATPTGSVTNMLTYTYPAGFSYASCTDPADNGQPVSTAGSCALVAELDRVVTAGNISGQTRVADFDYDPAGRMTRVIERSDAGAAVGSPPRSSDRTTGFAFYDRGALKSIDGPRTDVSDATRYGDAADAAYGGYHRSGQPLTLTDAAGKSKTFAYSPYGMITSVTDRDGRITTSRYDERDNLLEATVPGGATTSYRYDANDNKSAELQPARGPTSYRPTTLHTFDAMDRLKVVQAPGADESATTPVKTVTSTEYNADGSQRSVDGPLPGTGDTTTYSYYPNRLLREQRAPAADATAPAVTTWFYDAAGRQARTLHAVADAAGSRPVETVTYTPAGDVQTRASTATLGAGAGTAGNTDKAVDVAFNAHGEAVVTLGPVTADNRRGREETSYDGFGQPTQTRRQLINPDGTVKTLASNTGYDLAGNTTRVTQASGDGGQLESQYTFDALNRLAEQTKDPVNPNHKIRYSYNGEGQQTQRADITATGTALRTADTRYNDDNTKRSEIITTFDPRTPAAERVLATCNFRADGTSGFDIDGNLLYSRTVRGPTRPDGCALTDGAVLLREQQMSYDDRDWLTSSTMSVRSPATGAMTSRTQRMSYHANGSKATLTHNDGTRDYTTSYAITQAGWESTVTDWRSRSSELTYLPSGNITRQVLGRGGEQTGGVATADSTYKVDGTLASLSWTAAGTTVRAHTGIQYDRRGLRTSEQVSLRQPGKTSNDTGTAGYNYDLLDRLTRYTSPHPYDDAETRRPTTSYTLDDGGNITRELTTVPAQDGKDARTLADITSRYGNGRLDSRTAKQSVADLTSPLDLITTDETFTYNDLGEETRRHGTDKYVGADLATPLPDTTSSTDTSYDAAGHTARSLNEATKPVGTAQSEIDKANADVDYDYDTADRVISRRETKAGVTSTTLYFYSGTSGSLIEETDGAGKTKTRYLLDGEGENLAQQTYKINSDGTSSGTGEKWTWLLNDALGNTATVLDDLGKVIEQKAFDPFGKPENGATKKTDDTEAPTTTLGFQSARTDEATGRVMLGQRQYDPSTARFTTPDTYVAGMLDLQLGTDALTGNRYLFAGANPLAFYEDGHGFFGRLKKIAKAAVPALQYVPIVSTAIDVASAATGRNFYEGGRKMSGAERMMTLGGAAIGVVPGIGAAAKAGLAVAKGVNKAKAARKLAEAVDEYAPSSNQQLTGGGTYVHMKDGVVVRTGMTNDFKRRRSEHVRAGLSADKGFEFKIVHRVDDGPNAKATRLGLERKLYDRNYGTAHERNGGLNKKAPYRASNPKAHSYNSARQAYLARKMG